MKYPTLKSIAGTCLLGAAAGFTAMPLAGCASVPDATILDGSTRVESPPRAQDLASAFEDTDFKDCGQDFAIGVFGSGTASSPAGVAIGFDTFPGLGAEDAWLKQAVKIGVAPFQEADTWVAYRLTGPASDPCKAAIK